MDNMFTHVAANKTKKTKMVCAWKHVAFFTPRKINIEPENDGLEDDFPFPGVYSQGPC